MFRHRENIKRPVGKVETTSGTPCDLDFPHNSVGGLSQSTQSLRLLSSHPLERSGVHLKPLLSQSHFHT